MGLYSRFDMQNSMTQIAQDIDVRMVIYKKVINLIDKKIQIDVQYSRNLAAIISKQNIKIANDHLPSASIYKNLLRILTLEAEKFKSFGKGLQNTVSLAMRKVIEQDGPQTKKLLILGQSIEKDLSLQRQKLQRSKIKFEKKNKELERMKVDYLSSFLSNQHLQKKNQLYLLVSNCEQAITPLRQNYEYLCSHYNQLVETSSQKFNKILDVVESIQSKKMHLMKNALSVYLSFQKDHFDQIIRNNPFEKAQLDSISTDSNNEFICHSQSKLINQKTELLRPFVNHAQYIDAVYDRMENKRNIEEIILHGQTNQYRLCLSQIFEFGQCQKEGQICAKSTRMIYIFKHVFEVGTNEFLKEFESLIAHQPKVRKDFTLLLQKYRINNEFELRFKNRIGILQMIRLFLDHCDNELDTYNSKRLMVLSLTYHFMDQEKKIQLQELIKDHRIWKKIGWWQGALLESIYEQTRVKARKQQIPISIWDIKAGGFARREQGQQMTHQNICFNQLLYYVQNMSLFHLEPADIMQFAKFNVKLLKFNEKLTDNILAMCPVKNNKTMII